jgi:hypothetical protein
MDGGFKRNKMEGGFKQAAQQNRGFFERSKIGGFKRSNTGGFKRSNIEGGFTKSYNRGRGFYMFVARRSISTGNRKTRRRAGLASGWWLLLLEDAG